MLIAALCHNLSDVMENLEENLLLFGVIGAW
jgi:hypothetical protein